MTKFSLQPIVSFIAVVLLVVATHAGGALPPELYWKSKLPITPIPKSISDLLHPTGGGSTTVHGGIKRAPDPSYDYCYNSAPAMTKPHDNPNKAIFFLEKDLKAGHKMKFLFTQTSNQASSFLPREVAKSTYAEIMKDITIQGCGIKGEDKHYAMSSESMVDYITLKLGKSVEALSTELMKKETKKQEYTITNGVKKVGKAKVVACHKLDYVYAVFYCHKQENTVVYTVSLEGADGSRVQAVSVCHRDTSAWNPKHLAFRMLKVKPGGAPVCHFISQGDVLWVLKQN